MEQDPLVHSNILWQAALQGSQANLHAAGAKHRTMPQALALALGGTPVPERRGASACQSPSSHWDASPEQSPSSHLAASICQSPGSERLAALDFSGRCTQKIELLEEQVLNTVSLLERRHAAERREADRLNEFSMKDLETRVDSSEQRQRALETQVSDLSTAVDGMKQEQQKGAAFEQRLQALEQHVVKASAALNAAAATASTATRRQDSAVRESAEMTAVRGPDSPSLNADGWSGSEVPASDDALLAVKEMEALLQKELKAMQKRCNFIQDCLEERVLEPLTRVDLRLTEQEQKLREMTDNGRDCTARLEEHEFRIGVARTKLEVHDQKLAILDRALRWNRRLDSSEDQRLPVASENSCGSPDPSMSLQSSALLEFGKTGAEECDDSMQSNFWCSPVNDHASRQ